MLSEKKKPDSKGPDCMISDGEQSRSNTILEMESRVMSAGRRRLACGSQGLAQASLVSWYDATS